jgi:hypothetical protein
MGRTIFCVPPNGGKYNGKLNVTNRRLFYETKFDASLIALRAKNASTLLLIRTARSLEDSPRKGA